jgi:exosortase/archaeosortase family protein
MGRRTRRDRSVGRGGSGDASPPQPPRERAQLTRRNIFWFVGTFALLVALFYAFSRTDLFQQILQTPSLELNARLGAGILRLLGVEASSVGATISSPRFSVRIWAGCDALEPFGLYAAAVIASPVPILFRFVGVFGGALIFFLINQIRIVSIFLVGIHAPGSFETVHLDVWQTAFVFLVVIVWLLWAQWTSRMETSRA